jgi:hypothetical protein
MQRFLAEKVRGRLTARGGQSDRGSAMETVSAVSVAKGKRGAAWVERRRSQAGIIVISGFVMKINLHENR